MEIHPCQSKNISNFTVLKMNLLSNRASKSLILEPIASDHKYSTGSYEQF